MKIVSISNIKGGVGKTTTAAVLAVGLAEKGYRVLLIDSDPQTNLTMCFLQEQTDELSSLYDIYGDGESIDDVKVPVRDNMDLVIGDFELCNADMQFTKAGRLKMLKKAIKSIGTEYDFIVIDTPPNLGILSLNAFIASNYVLVPMTVDSFSLKGVRLLKETLGDVKDETEKELPVAGILLTRYNSRTNVSKLLEKSLNSAATLLDTELFKSRIRQAVVVQESQIAKEDLFSYSPNAKVAEDYKGFIDEFLERVGG
ncbi:MAG: ParA family protein [Lachnospiraceae bacterium]|jgi:chromosome partitioning protein